MRASFPKTGLAALLILGASCAPPKTLPQVPGGESHNFGYEARLYEVDASHWQVTVTLPSDFAGGWSGGLRGEDTRVEVWGGGLTNGALMASWTFGADRWRQGRPFQLELRQNVRVLVEVKLGVVPGNSQGFAIKFLEKN